MISFAASGKLWERNMEIREAEKAIVAAKIYCIASSGSC